MKKDRPLIPATFLALAFVCVPLTAGGPAPAATQKPIPPDCVEVCRQLLYECIAQGEKESRCISRYRSCTARCK